MSKKQNILVLVFSSVFISIGGAVHGQICDVTDDGSGCVQVACSPIPEDQCLPAALGIDWDTGAITVTECHCQDMNACHIEFGNATPFAVGYCPPDRICDVAGADLNNDGLPDLFRAVCRPDGVNVCCLDIDDGPVPFDTCADLGEETCTLEGGMHRIAPVGCSAKEACCLGSLTQPLCAELHPVCCLMSGGVPLGPETACTTANGVEVCGQICGGFAGLPCDDPRAFCRLPDGGCCCDFMGVCTIPPDSCPTVLDPVCGCDQNTYRNECVAFVAGVSIDHRGPCGQSACCLAGGKCAVLTLDVCLAEGGEPILNASCETIDCVPPPVGACCLSSAADTPTCAVKTQESCAAAGGAYQGDNTSCPTDPSVACGDRCNGLCADAASCFAGCGRLVQGFECVWFQMESGDVFVLDDLGGFAVGDHVFVKGCRSTDCIPTLCMPGDPCLTVITIRSCLAPCGGIAGIVCEDPSQFCKFPIGTCGDGDITGECSPRSGICPAVWIPVCGCNGVTYGNECEAAAAGVSIAHPGECVRVCGGLGPAPPCEPNEFCQFPVGACGDVTTQGVCVAIPNACPEIFDPVCGCDGMTYTNACEAVRAQVSIAHPGECTACTAIRVFSDPPFSYCPSEAKRVRIVLNAPANASVIALDDQPPAGWVVSEIGQGGVFDAVNGKVKWGPIFAPFPPTLTYVVTPVESNTAGSCFAGDVSIDGFNLPICGAACLDRSCCPGLAADEVQPACDQCPAGGCETCDDACGNGRVTMCELIGYACAWRHGCNDDLAGMTRAAFIWRNGECYCWDDADNTWQPTACDLAGGASCCSAGAGANSGIEAAADPSAGATVRIRRTTGDRFSRSSEAIIEAVINPPTGTMASGLEIDVPQGWKTVKVSDGGEWDAANGKVKWGPLFGDGRTVVSVTIRREVERVSRKARKGGRTGEVGLVATPSLKNLGGTVAFDGVMRPVSLE